MLLADGRLVRDDGASARSATSRRRRPGDPPRAHRIPPRRARARRAGAPHDAAVLGETFTLPALAAVIGHRRADARAAPPGAWSAASSWGSRPTRARPSAASTPSCRRWSARSPTRRSRSGTADPPPRRRPLPRGARLPTSSPARSRATTSRPTGTPRRAGTRRLAAQARIALRGAASGLAGLGAHHQALAFLEQALTVTTDPAEEAELLERAGESASAAGRYERRRVAPPPGDRGPRELGDRPAARRDRRPRPGPSQCLSDRRRRSRSSNLPPPSSPTSPPTRGLALGGQLARVHFLRGDNAGPSRSPTGCSRPPSGRPRGDRRRHARDERHRARLPRPADRRARRSRGRRARRCARSRGDPRFRQPLRHRRWTRSAGRPRDRPLGVLLSHVASAGAITSPSCSPTAPIAPFGPGSGPGPSLSSRPRSPRNSRPWNGRSSSGPMSGFGPSAASPWPTSSARSLGSWATVTTHRSLRPLPRVTRSWCSLPAGSRRRRVGVAAGGRARAGRRAWCAVKGGPVGTLGWRCGWRPSRPRGARWAPGPRSSRRGGPADDPGRPRRVRGPPGRRPDPLP